MCLMFVLILYIPVNNFSVRFGQENVSYHKKQKYTCTCTGIWFREEGGSLQFQRYLQMSNSLDPDQDLNCLQRLSADDTDR